MYTEKVHIIITIPLTVEAASEIYGEEDVRIEETLEGTQIIANATLVDCLRLADLVSNIDHDIKIRRPFNG